MSRPSRVTELGAEHRPPRRRTGPRPRDGRPAIWRLWRWPVWQLWGRGRTGPAALVLVLAVVFAGYGGLIAGWVHEAGTLLGTHAVVAVLLAGSGIAHTEIVLGLERTRASGRPNRLDHNDLSSTWTFAAVVAVGPVLAATVSGLVHLHLARRVGLSGRTAYRQAYSNASVIIVSFTSSTVLAAVQAGLGAGGPQLVAATAVALVAYLSLSTGLLLLAVGLATGEWRMRYGDDRIEICTLSLGALLGVLLLSRLPGPLAAIFFAPVLYLFSRAIAALDLDERTAADEPTGLANHAAWVRKARIAFRRASRQGRPVGVLRIDIDDMAVINERFGPRFGDRVISAVAEALRGATRSFDLLGRLTGTDEFVLLLPGVSEDLGALAERLASAVADLDLKLDTSEAVPPAASAGDDVAEPAPLVAISVCIGGALWPGDGVRLDELDELADRALDAARKTGPGTVALHGSLSARAYRRARRHAPAVPLQRDRDPRSQRQHQ